MKVYNVIAFPLDCEGRGLSPRVVTTFSSIELANNFKKDWENLWKKHTNSGKCITPCWYDFKSSLEIEGIEVKTSYNESMIYESIYS